MVLTAFLVTVIGRMFGGHGTFADALLAVAWIRTAAGGADGGATGDAGAFARHGRSSGHRRGAFDLYLTVTMTKALRLHQPGKVALVHFGWPASGHRGPSTLAPGCAAARGAP